MSTLGALAQTDDNILVAMVLGGNREAFAAIYDRYADRVHDFGYSMLRNSAAAADLTSVTFVQAARRIGQLGDNRPLYPWLYNLARGEAMSRLSGHTRPAMSDDLDPATRIISGVTVERMGDGSAAELTGPTTVLTGPTSVLPHSDLESLEFVAPPSGRAVAGSVALHASPGPGPAGDGSAPEPDPKAAARESMLRSEAAQRAQIWHAVIALPDADRALLDLHLRHNLEGAALGQAVGMPPDEAYLRLDRIRVAAGRPLGAWLLAADALAGDHLRCPELAELLRGWDGGYTGVIRKKVVRHVDTCTLCQTRHRELPSPWGLLASVPPVPAPSILRGTVLARAEYAAFAGPEPPRRFGLRAFAVPVAAAAAVALAVTATVLLWPDDDSEARATGNTAGSPSDAEDSDPDYADVLPPPLYLLPPQRTPGVAPPAIIPGAPAAPGPAGALTQAQSGPVAAPGAGVPAPGGPAMPPPLPDTTPPTVGSPRFDSATAACRLQRTVRVDVSDSSGVTSVALRYVPPGGGPKTRAMQRDGNTWVAQVGPWTGKGVAPLTATATDSAGNTASGGTNIAPFVTIGC